MISKNKFYENTKNLEQHKILDKYINEFNDKKERDALDIGCGAGRDSVALINNGWKVTALDIKDTRRFYFE